MGHKYDNFGSAYSAWVGQYADAKKACDNALTNAQAAYSGASDPVDKTHFGFATYAIEQLILCVKKITGINETSFYNAILYECAYWAKWDSPAPPEYELTAQKICEAWAKDDFAGKEWTVACIDRMRQLMWDKPFNIRWAASPTEPK